MHTPSKKNGITNCFSTIRLMGLGAGLMIMASCSADSEIMFNQDFSGQAQIHIRFSDVLLSYYRDITGNDKSAAILNPAAIGAELNRHRGIELLTIKQTNDSTLTVNINFEDINAVLRSETSTSVDKDFVTQVNTADGHRKLSLNLNKTTIPAILSLSTVSGHVLSTLLPVPGTIVDPGEYREDLIWALGEYEGSTKLAKRIDSSKISFIVTLPNQPIAMSGGTLLLGKAFRVKFSITILALLTLSVQEELFVVY